MAPLLPSNTPRFRVFYTTMGHQHSLQIRSHNSPSVVGDTLNAYFSAFGAAAAQATIDFVDFAPSGSDIFNPVTTGREGDIYSSAIAPVAEAAAWEFIFIGRTSGGRRVRFSRFGATALGTNYRYSAGESGQLDDVVAALVATGDGIRGIDDLTPVWKTYVNVKPNDHWVKVLR